MIPHEQAVEAVRKMLSGKWCDGREDLYRAVLTDRAASIVAKITPLLTADLQAKLDAADARERQAVEALDEAKALAECACGHDDPNDICMGHIAILSRVRADHPAFARAVEAERKRCVAIAKGTDAKAFRARYEVTYHKKRFDQYSHEKDVNNALNIQAEDVAAAIRLTHTPEP